MKNTFVYILQSSPIVRNEMTCLFTKVTKFLLALICPVAIFLVRCNIETCSYPET